MILRPLGDRVLIKPAEAPTTTESGLHLVEGQQPEHTGTVIAVGRPRHARFDEATETAAFLDDLSFDGFSPDACARAIAVAGLLRTLVCSESCVKPGDEVLFSWMAGQEVFLHDSDERYLLMREDDLIAVLEDDAPDRERFVHHAYDAVDGQPEPEAGVVPLDVTRVTMTQYKTDYFRIPTDTQKGSHV